MNTPIQSDFCAFVDLIRIATTAILEISIKMAVLPLLLVLLASTRYLFAFGLREPPNPFFAASSCAILSHRNLHEILIIRIHTLALDSSSSVTPVYFARRSNRKIPKPTPCHTVRQTSHYSWPLQNCLYELVQSQ